MCCNEVEDIHFTEALFTILELLGAMLAEDCLMTDEQINHFLDRFFSKLPNFLQKPLLYPDVA